MIKRKNTPQNFEHGAVILLVSALMVKLIGAIFKIPLKHLIGTLGFGYFSSAYDLFLPIYSLSMAGLPVAVSRIVAENMAAGRFKEAQKTLKVAQKAFLVTGFTGLAVMLLAIYPYVRITMTDAQNSWFVACCVVAIAPAILFCCIMSSFRGYYEGMRNMYPTAISDVIEALGKLVLGYGFAFIVLKMTGNVAYAAAGALAGIMVGTLAGVLYLALRHKLNGDPITKEELEISPQSRSGKVIFRCLVAIAVPVVLSSLATNITLLIDTTMIKWQLKNVMANSFEYISTVYQNSIADYNASAKEALSALTMPTFLYGIRGEAYTLYNLIPTLTTTLGIGAIPILTTAWVKKDMVLVKKNIESILRTTAIIAIPAGIGISAISRYAMHLLYSDVASVEIGGELLAVLGVAALFSGISVPITSMLQAIGKPMVPVKNIAVGAVLKIIVNLLLVGRPEINIKGAPVGTTICYLYIFISNIFCLIRYSGVRPNLFSTIVKPFIASLFCGGAAFAVSRLLDGAGQSVRVIVAVSIICASVVYLIALFALRTLTKEDINSFPKGEKISKFLIKLHLIR